MGGAYAVPEDLVSDATLGLRVQLGARGDGVEDLDRTYLDTFDGLAREAGLTLVWEGGRLVLRDGDEHDVAAADWAEPPAALTVADLPDGALRACLAPVIDVRAALPIARVRLRRRSFRVLDDKDKTVARIVLEEPAVSVDGGRRVPLTTRLSVVGVRGYDKAQRRVRRVVEQDLRLAEADRTLVDEAVARTGGTPGGVAAKPRVDLDGDGRTDAAAVAILDALLDVLEANLPGTLGDVDIEFLHDLRVSVRRTRAVQRELRRAFPPEELARFRTEFRWLQQVTGPTRDLDVYLLEFDEFAATLPDGRRGDLEPLRRLLVRRRAAERRRMVRALRSERTAALLSEWRAFLDRLPGCPESDRPDAARPVAEVAGRRIARVYRRMVRMGDAIGDDSPHTDLHELRKKGKELRYLLEFFGGLFPAGTVDPIVKRLKGLQDTLGRFQDREVQAATLRSLGPDIASSAEGAPALMAMGVLVEHLGEQQAQARAEFAARFASFASNRERAAVKETFG